MKTKSGFAMKKRMPLLCLLLFWLTVGCSSTEYLSFAGESERWIGEYSASITDGKQENGEYTFRFKLDDPKTVPTFSNLTISINNGKSKSWESSYTGATVKMKSACSGCAVTREDETLKVVINWDGDQEETFVLEPKR